MDNLQYVINNINSSETSEDAFQHFCTEVKNCGYERVVFSLMTDHPTLNLQKEHGLVTNYPDDWMKHYVSQKYAAIDPVRSQILASRKPFLWSELTKSPNCNAKQIKMMREAEEANVANGLGISMMSQHGEIAGIGLAKSQFTKNYADFSDVAKINLLSIFFYEKYRESSENNRKQIHLTPKEKDVLRWAAEGKTDEDIGTIMGIEVSTVRFHWNNIFEKLTANSRVYAVTKALVLKLIDPMQIKLPYQK